MRNIRPVGPYCDIVDARAPDNHLSVVRLGLRTDTFSQLLHHYFSVMVAQYYGMVQDGLLNAMHAFRGLKRPLMVGRDMQADQNVIIYSWHSDVDFIWTGSPYDGKPTEKEAPPRRVFVVLVREEQEPNESNVFGSIERWNWIKEDPFLPHAPVDWEQRYTSHLWSRL